MIGQFLSAFPDFLFDLPTHIRTTRYSNELAQSLRRSINFFAGEKNARLDSTDILDFIRIRDQNINLEWSDIFPSSRDTLRQAVEKTKNSLSVVGFTKETSGTSGPPLEALYSEYFQFLNSISIVPWFAAAAKINCDERMVAALALRNARSRKVIALEPWPNGRLLAKVSLDERRSNSFEETVGLISALDPEILISKPTIFEALLWGMDRFSLRTTARPRLLVSSGQPLSQSLSLKLTTRFDASVLDVYATTELGPAAARCPSCGSFHFDESKCLVEVEHERTFVSMILNDLMPVIKHRMDDIHYSGSHCVSGLRGFEVSRRKVGQFLPLSSDVAIDLGRLRIGKCLGTTVESIHASVQGKQITIVVKVDNNYRPPEETASILRTCITTIVPSNFSAELLVTNESTAKAPILRVLSY